jgi:hypothetical protein
MSSLTGTLILVVSDVSAASQTASFDALVEKALKVMMGYHDRGWIPLTVTVPAIAAEMTVTYEVELNSLWRVTTDQLKERMAAHTHAQMNELLANMMGCSSYTVTVKPDPTPAPPTPKPTVPPTPTPTVASPPVSTANRMLLSSVAVIVATAAMLCS